MRGFLVFLAVIAVGVSLALATGSQAAAANLDVDVVAAPSTLNLNSSGNWVTIHAAIPLANVYTDYLYVTVNGGWVSWVYVKADNRGELVIKLSADTVKGVLQPGIATFRVCGVSSEGWFAGSDEIVVIRPPRK